MNKRMENLKELVKGTMSFDGEADCFRSYWHCCLVTSPIVSGKLISVDFSACKQVDGFIRGVVAADIPGVNGHGSANRKEEPLLADKNVRYLGQPVGFVIARTQMAARKAARLCKVNTEDDGCGIVTIEDAINKKSFYTKPLIINCGDVTQAYKTAKHRIEGNFVSGGQEHAYLETQRAFASYDTYGRNIVIQCSTQSISDAQQVTALALGLEESQVEVDVYRIGGAFGGKEKGGTVWAALAALGLYLTHHPCCLVLERNEDIRITGKRHPYLSYYHVGFDDRGKITSFQVELYANGGYYEDLSLAIVERAVFAICNAYYLPNAKITGTGCRTNLPPNTAFRGFGAPQATLVMEEIIFRIAGELGKDVSEIQEVNFLEEGQKSPYGMIMEEVRVPEIHAQLLKSADYIRLCKEKAAYNASHHFSKKGLGIVPIKYGIGFTATFLNQGNALINIFTDGSISVSHGGIEMGQGLYTKVEEIVARTLGVSVSRVHNESTNTHRVGTVTSTAASTGTDINGAAARKAALTILASLKEAASHMFEDDFGLPPALQYVRIEDDMAFDIRASQKKYPFEKLVSYCYFHRYRLGAQAHFATPGLQYDKKTGKGTPFSYFTNGVALSGVTIDVLTGTYTVDLVHIRHEGGNLIDYDIDRGQVVGGFIQGLGYVTMEDLPVSTSGVQLADSFAKYKVPLITDFPTDFTVDLIPTDDKICGVLGNKGIGEPPFLYGISVFNALRDAVAATAPGKKVFLRHPATAEHVLAEIERLRSSDAGGSPVIGA
ncbi:MAG: molybdopterin-dependent oxidoreductase [Spirochaetia bacterium]|jgi:xanthine dehydrogenase large subunit|nr:molybdopterin-dependent oxidoreductase [Spirochaetia bacterium]